MVVLSLFLNRSAPGMTDFEEMLLYYKKVNQASPHYAECLAYAFVFCF